MYKLKSEIYQLNNKLIKNGALHVILGSFLTKFVSFFGSIFLVRIISKSDYGVLSYFENFISYFTILAGLGLASGLSRYIVLADDVAMRKSCFNYALKRGSVWNIILVVIATIFMTLYPHPAAFRGYNHISIMLIICIPFVFLCNSSLSTLRALFDYKSYAFLAFTTSVFLILMRILGAAINGLNGAVLFRLLSEIICAVSCLICIFFKYFKIIEANKLDSQFSNEMNSYSFQIMITDGLWAIFMLNDMFILGQMIGDLLIIADYKVAYVIPANLSILTNAIGIFVAPYFTRHEKENDWGWIKKNYKLLLAFTTLVMGVLTILCFISAVFLITLMYGKKYLSAVPIMRVLLLASFFNNGIRSAVANILSAMGMQKTNLFVAAGGIVLQILLDVLLIPIYGSKGVAFSSVLVYLFMGIILLLFLNRTLKKKTKDGVTYA